MASTISGEIGAPISFAQRAQVGLPAMMIRAFCDLAELPDGLDTGWYVQPTLFARANNAMRIAREEIFGPVITVIPYSDDDAAVAIANDSDYGLAGSVWSDDTQHALAIAERIRTGTLGINQGYTMDPFAPFGGVKSSGYGRELGPEGLDSYLNTKSIAVERSS